jgi:hypothetical protein
LSDVAGRATAMTLITPLRRGGLRWARVVMWLGRRVKYITTPLVEMSFIHFARWTLIERLPGDPVALPRPVQFFESNFDCSVPQYIDAFGYVMPWRMRVSWGLAAGNPGIIPTNGFIAWVGANSAVADHYYSAYPEATITIIGGALALRDRMARFSASTKNVSDEEFAAAYRSLLTDVQAHL